jgi:hypothetical protein
MLTMGKEIKLTARYSEFLTDALSAVDASNAHLDGDNDTIAASPAVTRLANRTQIVKKTAAVSGTTEAVNLYGTKSELAYQMAKRSKELKRDMETIMMGKQASTAGSASAAAKLGALQGYMSAGIGNIVYSGAKGSATTPGWSGGNTGAIVNPSATAALDETKFKSLVKLCYDNGAENADVFMVGSFNRQKASTFTGIADLYRETNTRPTASILGTASVYISDFSGPAGIKIVSNRFQSSDVGMLIDMDMVQVGFLRPYTSYELAKTGDSTARSIVAEFSILPISPESHGKIVGLTVA